MRWHQCNELCRTVLLKISTVNYLYDSILIHGFEYVDKVLIIHGAALSFRGPTNQI